MCFILRFKVKKQNRLYNKAISFNSIVIYNK